MKLIDSVKEKIKDLGRINYISKEYPIKYDGQLDAASAQRGKIVGVIPIIIRRDYIDNNGNLLSVPQKQHYIFPTRGYFREKKQLELAQFARFVVSELGIRRTD